MKKYSFRLIITVTLVVVITAISTIAFLSYNYFIKESVYHQAEKSAEIVLNLLKSQYYFSPHNGKQITRLLESLHYSDNIQNTYLLDSSMTLLYASNYKEDISSHFDLKKFINNKQDIYIRTNKSESNPYLTTLMKMQNDVNCYECHSAKFETLGYIGYDLSIVDVKVNKLYALKFSVFFALTMVIFIVLFVILLHYKFVKKSLSNIQTTINHINKGDLNDRITIPKSVELSSLGEEFNNMLDNFQNAQKELKFFHQKELKEKQKLATIGEMSARLAHEIRNPITGISNAIEVIVDEVDNKELISILEEIKRQAGRVNVAVTSLLNYSNKKKLTVIKHNINEKIESIVFFIEKQQANNKVRFITNLEKTIPDFGFDHEQIEKVLVNLVLNAITAMNYNGVITLKTTMKSSGEHVVISIADTGTGITDELKTQIFTPFFTTKTEGTGLGLAISKEIIDKHCGEIWVEDNKEGGSIFYITLPIDLDSLIV